MALAREWDELVGKARTLKGFEDFLRPPRAEALFPAADGGPVVIVNVSRWRCDALIVTEEGVRLRALPELTLEHATQWADEYLQTLHAAELAGHEHQMATAAADTRPGPAALRAQARAAGALMEAEARVDDMLRSLQARLWDTIAAPVLGELGLDRVPPGDGGWTRIWWCPTGPLTLLPLHTAGYHVVGAGEARETVMDRVVSSYTPTLRALLEARGEDRNEGRAGAAAGIHRTTGAAAAGHGATEPMGDGMLVVAVEEAAGLPWLHSAAQERTAISELLPAARRTLLLDSQATREAVRTQLERHRWAHFSCHGDQNLADPSRGGLLLYDGMLTIADISARRFRGDFAGLSACKTAVGGTGLLDEVVTLAAALHHTGFRHVVAALWSVDDATAAQVFSALYGRIVTDGTLRPEEAAHALHHVVRAVRDAAPDEPRLWTPFTHTGP